jgi:predicted Zn-dependent protease
MELGRAGEAIPHFEALLKQVPDSLEGAYRLAQAHQAAGQAEKADEALERALRIAPGHLPSLVARLRGHALAGRMDAARAVLAELERRYPDDPEVRAQAGWLAARGEDHTRALTHLEAAWAKAPSPAFAREISALRLAVGDHDGAVAALRAWLDEHPDDATLQGLLGRLLIELERRDEGLAALREVVRLRPEDPLALNNLAWYLVASEPAEALRLAERAHAKASENLAIIDTLARARSANQDHTGAERLLRDALVREPGRVELRLSLANALEAAGNAAAARTEVEAILAKDPEHATAKALLARLAP